MDYQVVWSPEALEDVESIASYIGRDSDEQISGRMYAMALALTKPDDSMQRKYTQKQGQYLAFIHYYTKIYGYPPAEADMQRYFKMTLPSVHQMVLTLEKLGLIERVPGKPRTIRVVLPREELPDLE